MSTLQKTGWTILSLSWSFLVWKRVSLWMWSLGGSQQPFFLCFGPFSTWWKPNERTTNQVILVQACSWPVWEGSLLQNVDSHWFYSVTTTILGNTKKRTGWWLTPELMEVFYLGLLVSLWAPLTYHPYSGYIENCKSQPQPYFGTDGWQKQRDIWFSYT